MYVCEDVSSSDVEAYFRVRTWFADDMLDDARKPVQAGEGETTLGESWLAPRPFKQVRMRGSHADVCVSPVWCWEPQ